MKEEISKQASERSQGAIHVVALRDFKPDDKQEAPADRIEILEQFVSEVTTTFEATGIPPRRWFVAIITSSFAVAEDRIVPGPVLLAQLHSLARQIYSDVSSDLSSEAATFRHVVSQQREIKIETAIDQLRSDCTFELPREVQEVRNLNDTGVVQIEGLLRQVLDHHCAGNLYDLSYALLQNVTYKFNSGLQHRGDTILQALCLAKYRSDTGDTTKPVREVIKLTPYKPESVLATFKKEEMLRLLKSSDRSIVTIEGSLANLDLLELPDLMRLAVRAVHAIARQPGITCEGQDLIGLRQVRDSEGNTCSLMRLLTQVAQARWIEKYPGNTSVSPGDIIQKRGFTVKDTLRFLERSVRTAAQKKAVSDMSNEEVKDVVSERGLSPILDTMIDLASDPSIMVDTIRLLRPQDSGDLTLDELVPRYVGLKVGKGPEAAAGNQSGPGNGIDNGFIAALLSLAATGMEVNFSQDEMATAKEIAIRSHRKSFEREPDKLLSQLLEHIETLDKGEYRHLTEQQLEVMKNLLGEVRQHFADVLQEDLGFMKSKPFNYQREGVRFLRMRDTALLADDAGLAKTYQLIAAAIAREERVLYITPAATVHNVKREILGRSYLTEDQVAVITSDSPTQRKRAIHALTEQKFVIIGYETLSVLHKRYKRDFAQLQKGIGLVIMDEAHTPENERTDRGGAVRALSIDKKWFATATPYRNGVEGLFWMLNALDPETFSNQKFFVQTYCRDLGGLHQLNRHLRRLMLRRTKDETVEYFSPPGQQSFADQLAEGQPRVPRQRLLDPAEKGAFALSPEQEQTLLWMISDFRGWAAEYNERFAPHGEEIDLATLNPLLKFQIMHKAIYEPEEVGLQPSELMHQAIDDAVNQAINSDRKIILWVSRYANADFLGARYSKHGALILDGRTKPEDRVQLIEEFQNDPNVRILVGNELALGTGVTITAAHEALLVQPSWTPTRFIQTIGRHQRVIGLDNLKHAKEFAETAVLIPYFSDSALRGIDDPELAEILERGTLPAQTYQRLRGGLQLYRVVTDGYQDEEKFFREFQRSLLSSMGLVEGERRYDLTGGIKPSQKAMVEVAKVLAPVWKVSRDNREIQDALFQLVAQARFHQEGVMKVAKVISHQGVTDPRALRFISAIFEIKNRAVRNAILDLTPKVLERLSGTEFEFRDEEIDIDDGAVNILRILPVVLSDSLSAHTAGLQEIIDESVALGSSPAERSTRRSLLFGLIPFMSQEASLPEVLSYLNLPAAGVSLEHRVKAIYQLGKLLQIEGRLPEQITQGRLSSFQEFAVACETAVRATLERKLSIRSGAITETLQRDSQWNNSVDHILGFVAGWLTLEPAEKRDKLMAQAAEVFGAVFADRLAELRASSSPSSGRAIRYKADDPQFWSAMADNERYEFDSLTLNQELLSRSIVDTYQVLKREIYATGVEIEGEQTGQLLQGALRSDTYDIEIVRRSVIDQQVLLIDALARIKMEDDLTPEQEDLLKSLKLSAQSPEHDWYKARLDGERSLEWLRMEEIVRDLRDRVTDPLIRELEGLLKKKQTVYENEGRPQISYSLELAAQQLRAALGGRKSISARIEETDHPAIISRMGCLSPAMVNCFNPDSEPVFTQWVLGALASKNFKLLVARESKAGERILAAAASKVRRIIGEEAEDTATLFLERGLSELAYNFRREMLELLSRKAGKVEETAGTHLKVAHQILGRVSPSDVRVGGTGAYTVDEYAEAVFHLRSSSGVVHMARLYSPDSYGIDQEDRVLHGMGVGQRKLDRVVADLRRVGARVVIDIRAKGRSRLTEPCPKDKLEQDCTTLGIDYQDWSVKLGNPQGGDGKFAYAAYQEFMRAPEFQSGVRELQDLIEQSDGRVVILGSKPKQRHCTRGLLIHALSQLLWDPESQEISVDTVESDS